MKNCLYSDIRKKENLFAAWRHVRRSALQSRNDKIRGDAGHFEHDFHTHVTRIQNQLREKRYVFDKSTGVLADQQKRKLQNKDPRPIVISTIESRLVQRAILQVLQPKKIKRWIDEKPVYETSHDDRLGRINDVNRSQFGVGGLIHPYGGVEKAISFVDQAMQDGNKYFYQTDIKSFFTKIRTENVVEFLKNEIEDTDFCNIFEQALRVELNNPEELGNYKSLFPDNGEGVAQGSSLSAFSGNVLLYEFDMNLNKMGVKAVRYIDDIFVLAKTADDRTSAEQFCTEELKKIGLSIYKVSSEKNAKARRGMTVEGFDLLGCTVYPNSIRPSSNSQANLLKKLDTKISLSKRDIKKIYEGELVGGSRHSFAETLYTLGKQVYGWQKSFSFCNDVPAFEKLDDKISKKIEQYTHFWNRMKSAHKADRHKMALSLGVSGTARLLAGDIEKRKGKSK